MKRVYVTEFYRVDLHVERFAQQCYVGRAITLKRQEIVGTN